VDGGERLVRLGHHGVELEREPRLAHCTLAPSGCLVDGREAEMHLGSGDRETGMGAREVLVERDGAIEIGDRFAHLRLTVMRQMRAATRVQGRSGRRHRRGP